MEKEDKEKTWRHEKGVTYFSRKAERTLFFVLTLVMLAWGLVEMLGWF